MNPYVRLGHVLAGGIGLLVSGTLFATDTGDTQDLIWPVVLTILSTIVLLVGAQFIRVTPKKEAE